MENNNTNNQQENKKKNIKKFLLIFFLFDLIVAIIFLLFLGIQRCSGPSSHNSSNPSINYDVEKLDNKFKSIVNSYRLGPGGMSADNIVEVEAVTYIDNYDSGSFSLSITVLSESNKVYLYTANNVSYPEDKSKFDNLVSYLLLEDTPDIFDGDNFALETFNKTEEVISTDKVCKYVISSNISGTASYLDGFYFENNNYYVYQNKEVTNDNPFGEAATMVIEPSDPLYPYYQSLNK